MCNIVALKAGVSMPFDKFENMVYNNPHGFGLILKDPSIKRLEVIRRFHADGTNPKELYELVEDNKDLDRYLHVRWRTEGPLDIDNTHPFTSYYSDKRQIYFMHNGTLNDFRPKSGYTVNAGGVRTQVEGEQVSDSKKFNDELLAPLLTRLKGENGEADIHDPVFTAIVNKFWNVPSKGILISNDLEPVLINSKDWKEMDFGGGKFWSSNDSYFNNLSRGQEYERRKKEKEEEDRKKREAEGKSQRSRFQSANEVRRSFNGGLITDLKTLDLKSKEWISENLSKVLEDYNIWTEEGMASLSLLTEVELENLVEKNPTDAVQLLVLLSSYYASLHKKMQKTRTYLADMKKSGKSDISPEDIENDDV